MSTTTNITEGIVNTSISSDTSQFIEGYPHPNPSISFWLANTRSSFLLGHRSNEGKLPDISEVVIVGSGLAGAATAYFLMVGPNPPKTITLLEAREVCHGATGRNGGQCRPDCYRGYRSYKELFGRGEALKILKNEMDTLNLIEEIVKKEGINCDFWRGKTFDVALNQEVATTLKANYDEMVADGGEKGYVKFVDDPKEASEWTKVPDCKFVAEFPAGSLWPFKLVEGLFKICLEKGLNLQTSTLVRSIEQGNTASGETMWTLNTDRGSIQASKLICATNAYTGSLIPELRPNIVPFRGECSAIVPTKPFSGKNKLDHTYFFRYDVNNYDYMIQRPTDGIIISGGGYGKGMDKEMYGRSDDSKLIPGIREHLEKSLPSYFGKEWGEPSVGEGLERTWTGIMGFTTDTLPFIGEVPNKDNLFVIAGFQGRGMVRIMTCAKGLASYVNSKQWEDTYLPKSFKITTERLNDSRDYLEKVG